MQIEAVRIETEAGRDFSVAYPEQFVLTRDAAIDLPGWDHLTLHDWHLWRAPNARTKRILDRSGRLIGWLLGEAVDAQGTYLIDPVTLPMKADTRHWLLKVERWVEGLAGRFAVILPLADGGRLYQDPVGDFSVVYDPQTGIVASSVLLALTRPLRWNARFNRKEVLKGAVHFSLGHTADEAILRMRPNHFLDLALLALHRHWPRADTVMEIEQDQLPAQIEAISDRLGAILQALVTNASCLLPLSGGRDSRNLLGAMGTAKQSLVAAFTISFHNMSHVDKAVAATLAERAGLPHFGVNYKRTSKQERLSYYRYTGFADGGSALHVLGSHLTLPEGHITLRGNVMELLRANQWNEATALRTGRPHTRFGLRRLLISTGPDSGTRAAPFAEEYEAWVATLPKRARRRQLDLGFVEQLLPNTLGVRHFGYTNNFVMNPFACRRLIHLAMQIPPELRMADRPNEMLLARNCADLTDIPFEREVAGGAELPEPAAEPEAMPAKRRARA